MDLPPVKFLNARRLYLRPLEESDLPLCQRWINDPEIRRTILNQRPMDLRAERNWWEHHDRKTLPRSISLAIVLHAGDRHIGNTGLHQIDWINRAGETGTLIGEKDCWGQGYAVEAKELLLEYAFETLNLHRIDSHTLALNVRSARHLVHCGYVEEGRVRQRYFRDGEWHDAILYGLLREEWRARRKATVGA